MGDACNEKRLRVLTLDVASFHGFLSARFVLHFLTLLAARFLNTTTDNSFFSPKLLLNRHQKAKETREEILEGHGPEVSPQPKVLQEAQQSEVISRRKGIACVVNTCTRVYL